MKVLIAGAGGQLGRALQRTIPHQREVVALTSAGFDITDAMRVDQVVAEHRPDLIINAAAYTAVDRAEGEVELADAVNHLGAGYLAKAARAVGSRLVHVSTDFVFGGNASQPYRPNSPTSPLSVYGATKLAGERAVGQDAMIVRTAWVYGPDGGNFLNTMLRLMGDRDEIAVVCDQIGTPTSVDSLAEAIWDLSRQDRNGVWHYTDSGVASWYDFAVAIKEEARAMGLLDRDPMIKPISSAQYPTPAKRPSFSVLDKQETFDALGRHSPHWRANLRQILKVIQRNG